MTRFSAAILRRRLLEAITCGGCSVATRKRAKVAAAFKPVVKSDRLSDLITEELSDSGSESSELAQVVEEREMKSEKELEEFQRVVSALHPDNSSNAEDDACGDRRREAALEVRRMAKEDAEARETLAMLGAIPPLVGMLDAELDIDSQVAALYAILNLAIGNDMNKAAIVKAGAVHKMLGLIRSEPPPSVYKMLSEAIVANFLSLSALDANKQIIGSSEAVPFLIKSLRQNKNSRLDALRALYNLSIVSANSQHLIDAKASIIDSLLAAIGDMDATDHALATLSNLVASSAEARQHLSRAHDSFPILIDVLGWTDAPSCQEKSAYVLMVMAHKSHFDRAGMDEAGISSALLELTLMGTPLAQKRASRILEMLRSKKGKEVSAPMAMEGKGKAKIEDTIRDISDEKMAVKQLVQQSLHCNMRRIARRANLPEEIMPSTEHLSKALGVSATSKSLTF